jgi:ribosomal protein S18 acetylase RimI-like enzyme
MQMKRRLFDTNQAAQEIELMRRLLESHYCELAAVDLEELMALPEIQERTKFWLYPEGGIVGFAFVDDFSNLVFSMDPGAANQGTGDEIVAWGCECLRSMSNASGQVGTLDAICKSANLLRADFLIQHGFEKTEDGTLEYERNLADPIEAAVPPTGFKLRHVLGEAEAEALVDLHRAAFGSVHMTLEYRLAMMRTAEYDPELDLLLEAPGGELAAFCVCMTDKQENLRTGVRIGSTDPVGVHPVFWRRGLGKSVLTAGMRLLSERGMSFSRLGTSSKNIPMQRLAEACGFRLREGKHWFSKIVYQVASDP